MIQRTVPTKQYNKLIRVLEDFKKITGSIYPSIDYLIQEINFYPLREVRDPLYVEEIQDILFKWQTDKIKEKLKNEEKRTI